MKVLTSMKVFASVNLEDLFGPMSLDEIKGCENLIARRKTQLRNQARGISGEELEMAMSGKRIQAIQMYRERTGAGLRESKGIIDMALEMYREEAIIDMALDRECKRNF